MTAGAQDAASVRRAVGHLAPALVRLSHDLHREPETAWQERRSSRRIAEFLRGAGLDVAQASHGLPTAFRAAAGRAGPLVVVCCEYDALPDLGHGCGHNVVAAAAAGAAAVLAPLAPRHGGRVLALGTPAEEGGGGKIELLRRGAFDGASAVLLAHPGTHDQVRATFRAAASYTVVFRGRAAHAAMAPGTGRNALDAAILAYGALSAGRSSLGPGEQLTAVLARGGTAPNVVPDVAELRVMTRAVTTAGLAPLQAAVRRAAQAGALATGCTVGLRAGGPCYREMRTDPRLALLLERHMRALGRAPRPQEQRDLLVAGSTDLGNVSQVVPSAHPKLSIGDVSPHSRDFARAAVAPPGDRAVLDGAALLALTALDVWTQTHLEGSRHDHVRVPAPPRDQAAIVGGPPEARGRTPQGLSGDQRGR